MTLTAPMAAENGTTDERLLAVAERLFAVHGIDAVSLRSITIEAEANIAAVHYHFGTKVDLVRALVQRRVDEVNTRRLVLLRAAERAAGISARDIATIWIEPLTPVALDPQRRQYLGFVVALRNASPEMRALAGEVFRPHFARIDAAVARALPDVATPLRRMRFTLAVEMSMRALADLEQLAAPWRTQREPITDGDLIHATTDAFTGLLLGSSS